MRKIELLAPAGSLESLKAAVGAGADAVYIGGTRFGARAYADNLSEEEMKWAIDYAHLHGVSLYMTVNTLFKEEELEKELCDYIRPFYEHGLDAVIVQDLGVVRVLEKHFPKLPVHISTQMTVTGSGGFQFLEEFSNVTRVVTARELSLEEIKQIREKTDLEIESFVHGALCYCYSGQCLFSSMIGGRSGNRGRCAQPCRLPYEVLENGKKISGREETYVLSPKDMNTLELLGDILDAGIDSLKIEGRMKRPEYTAGVVRIYRKYIDAYLQKGSKHLKISPKDLQELEELYRKRGYSKGYYKQHNGRNMIAMTAPTDLREETQRNSLMEEISREYVQKEKKEKIKGILEVSTENPMKFTVKWGTIQAEVWKEAALVPKNRAMTEADFVKQLSKTGNTPFVFENLEIRIDGEVFVPNGAINELRRMALELLEEKKLQSYRRIPVTSFWENKALRSEEAEEQWKIKDFHVAVETREQLLAAQESFHVSSVYIDSSLMSMKELKKYAKKSDKEIYYILPAVFREDTKKAFQKEYQSLGSITWAGFVIRNLESYQWVVGLQEDTKVITDAGLYTFNREASSYWREKSLVIYDTIPLELNHWEISKRGAKNSELVIYGRIPMMISAGCVYKTMNQCRKGQKEELHPADYLQLKDRKQKRFPVKPVCKECYNVIYNAQPLSLLGQREKIFGFQPKSLRMSFTVESYQETKELIERFALCFLEDRFVDELDDFTRGHFTRGIE